MASRGTIAFTLHNMLPAPKGNAVPQVLFRSDDGILLCFGTTVPTDGATGYGTGCHFRHTVGGVGTALYVNEGTAASADVNAK